MIFKNIFVYPRFPKNLHQLYEMSCNLWCIWDYDAINLFYRIDTQLFRKVNHNPLRFLHSLSKEKLQSLSEDKGFLFEFKKVWDKYQHYLEYTFELKDKYKFQNDDTIAYFSMEFGLHESIPIYAGGLGILSGDFLKGASDLSLPIIGISLLYQYGYFKQHIDIDGYQREIFAKFENYPIPIRELHDDKGNWARIKVRILNDDVLIKLWKIDIGKTKLILLDTNIEENPPYLRDITNELYVSDREKRIQQELVLGVGGIRALNFLGINTKIYHFNEGHSAFAIIGRLQELMTKDKFNFSQAKAIIRNSTVFTTHTPVIAGNENLDIQLVKKYIEPKLQEIGLPFEEIAKYGYVHNNQSVFWLPAFAMQFSKYINGVSKQHALIAKKMWVDIFPERPILEIPVLSITNGVHNSWISQPFNDIFNRYLGPDFIHCCKRDRIWKKIYNIPDEELWDAHRKNKKDLVNFVRRQFANQMAAMGYSSSKLQNINRSLNTDYLTIVFARRFAVYKRPTLILRNKKRLKKILCDPSKPVQIIFTGKAHPADEYCKGMIKEIIDFAKEYEVEDKIIFLEDYDINIARHLSWGADIWLNNPIIDMEASGTSGMKAAMNGVLHLSTLEGWWVEGFNGQNGWAITAGRLYKKQELQDMADVNQIYDLLENKITDIYYSRNESDIPQQWIKIMKDSIFSVCQDFNINRVLFDYLNKAYIPSKEKQKEISAENYKLLKLATEQENILLKNWDSIKINSFAISKERKDQFGEGEKIEISCQIDLGDCPSDLITVELFYMYNEDTIYKVLPMKLQEKKQSIATYKHTLEIEGYGSQNLNVRIKPANEIVFGIHPELIKWKD